MKDYEDVCDQITLTLDDDSELLCDVLATFPATVNGKEQMYIALLPTDATPESEIYLYRFIEDGDDIDLQNIEDDDEYEIAADGSYVYRYDTYYGVGFGKYKIISPEEYKDIQKNILKTSNILRNFGISSTVKDAVEKINKLHKKIPEFMNIDS